MEHTFICIRIFIVFVPYKIILSMSGIAANDYSLSADVKYLLDHALQSTSGRAQVRTVPQASKLLVRHRLRLYSQAS